MLKYNQNIAQIKTWITIIENEKAAIDEYLRINKDADIGMANQKMHDKYVGKILKICNEKKQKSAMNQ